MVNFLLTISQLLLIYSSSSLIHAQQLYIKKAATTFDRQDNSALGYTCNGLTTICKAYLTFRSHPPYNSVYAISTLLSADSSEISALNSVTENSSFQPNKLVIVPVNCSCSGEYYQANASYIVNHGDTRFLITNNTFQGLSTYQAIRAQNSNPTTVLHVGTRLVVPLRCACPTKDQSDSGFKYLLTYLVTWRDSVPNISSKFDADVESTFEANELSQKDSTLYPFTTLLVPLQKPPLSSQTIPSPPPPPPPPPPPSLSSSTSSNVLALVVILGVLALVFTTGVVLVCIFFCKSKKKKDLATTPKQIFENSYENEKNRNEEKEAEFLELMSSAMQSIKVYSFDEIQSATEKFSSSCLIKGSVYRGTINGDFVAIKEMNDDVSKEINLLNKICHVNLVLLSGFCFHEGRSYLVYEYAANGSLSDWIYYDRTDPTVLTWTQRIQIALDVATGLNYIHSYTSPPCVHRDLKASNVLLDCNFRAKIANFNLARLAQGQNDQFSLTKEIVGTKGYIAPEYLEYGLVSSKLDVYAFGVLMMEILGAKTVAVFHEVNSNLGDVLLPILEGDENLRNFIDKSLKGNYPIDLAMCVVRLTSRCLQKDPTYRPEMEKIMQILSTTLNSSRSWDSFKIFRCNQVNFF